MPLVCVFALLSEMTSYLLTFVFFTWGVLWIMTAIDSCFNSLPVTKTARWAYSDIVLTEPDEDDFDSMVRDCVGVEAKLRLRGGVNFLFKVGSQISQAVTEVFNGTGQGSRVGNRIKPLALESTLTVFGQPEAGAFFFQARVGYLMWHEDEGKTPFDPDKLLFDPGFPGGAYAYNSKGSFTILWDEFLVVSNTIESANFMHTVCTSLDLSKLPEVLYDGPAKTDNQIFFFALSDAGIADEHHPFCTFTHSFYYSDS